MGLKEKSFVAFSWIFHSFALFRPIYSKGLLTCLLFTPFSRFMKENLMDFAMFTLLF